MPHNPTPTTRYFPDERLEASRLALHAIAMVAARRDALRGLPGQAGPQLERAVVGAYTNFCSGAALHGAEARRHHRIALSEACEAGGVLDIALACGALDAVGYRELRDTLLRLGACLRGLTQAKSSRR